jgi:histidinol-phosphatase (PHP family)
MNLKNISDYHTHNLLCRHAEGSLEDYVKTAVKLGLGEIGFCDHFPMYYLPESIPIEKYAMTMDEFQTYIKEAERLTEKYKCEISVKIGTEVDYMEGKENIISSGLNKFMEKLDYTFGSCHILMGRLGAWCIDDPSFIDLYNNYKIDWIYEKYYEKLNHMVDTGLFDVVSHFDLPKKFKKFPKNRELIHDKALRVLETIKEKNLVVEINTGGYRREVKEQYPSLELIEEIYKLDIPILLGSDAHLLSEVGYMFEETLKKLRNIGFTQLVRLTKRKKEYIDI